MSTQTNFQTLGRLGSTSGAASGRGLRRRSTVRGGGIGGGPFGLPFTPSLPSGRTIAIAVAVVLTVLFVLGKTAQSQLSVPAPSTSSAPSMDPVLEASLLSGGTQMAATGSRLLIPGGGAAAGMVEVPKAFAAVDDLALTLISSDPQGVIFSEADAVDMLPLAPVGELVDNANPEGFEATQTFEGPDYKVAAAATGIRPATGLARILVNPGAELLSPVTGTVVAVDEYSTADGGRDWRVVVQPATRHDLHVVIRRIGMPYVTVGQDVGVGQAVLGQVRDVAGTVSEQNPLGLPSAWVSVRPAIDEESIDPYAPAVTASTPAD